MYVLGPPNFTGLRCEQGRFIVKKKQVPILFLEVDFCSSNPCKSNGRCLSSNSSYRCECYDGYMGENCDGNIILSHILRFGDASKSFAGDLVASLNCGICDTVGVSWPCICIL